MNQPVREFGVAGFAALSVMLVAAAAAAGLVWLMTTDPVSVALLVTGDGLWRVLASVAQRLLTII